MHLSLSPQAFVDWLQCYPAEALTIVQLISCGLIILVLMRFFGAMGLIVYSSIAVIAGNLQVQTAAIYSFFHEPIALGTIVFSSIFIVSTILTEYYGKNKAQQAVWLSFLAMILLTYFMLLAVGFKPANGFGSTHKAINLLFIPAPALITASLIAYTIGQLNDIWVFATLSRLTRGKYLWLRSLLAILIGGFLDILIFSVLAWVIFAPHPLPWKTVLLTYVLGPYLFRAIAAIAGVPFIYLARLMVRT